MRCSDKLQLGLTCGKHDVPRHQLVVDDGELRQLDPCHPRHGRFASFPVELDVVCGVAICTGKKQKKNTPRCNHLSDCRWRPKNCGVAAASNWLSAGKSPKKIYRGGKKKFVWSCFQTTRRCFEKAGALSGSPQFTSISEVLREIADIFSSWKTCESYWRIIMVFQLA